MTPFTLVAISISLKPQEVIPSREGFKVLYSTHAFICINFKDKTKEKLLRKSCGLYCKRKNVQMKVVFVCLIKKNE